MAKALSRPLIFIDLGGKCLNIELKNLPLRQSLAAKVPAITFSLR